MLHCGIAAAPQFQHRKKILDAKQSFFFLLSRPHLSSRLLKAGPFSFLFSAFNVHGVVISQEVALLQSLFKLQNIFERGN